MRNSMKTIIYHELFHYEVQDIIIQHTNWFFDIVEEENWINHSSHKLIISPFKYNFNYQKYAWQIFKETGKIKIIYKLNTILNGLCSDGLMIAGTYHITTKW